MFYAAAFAAMCGFYLLYQHNKFKANRNKHLTIAFKCAATSMAVLVGLSGAIANPIGANWVMLGGLVLCTVADGLLCVYFTAGGVMFGLGHLVYMTAFMMMHRPGWLSLALFAVLLGGVMKMLRIFKSKLSEKRFLQLNAYGTALCLMAALSAAQRPLFFAGAMLFVFSDVSLCVLRVKKNIPNLTEWDYVSLGAYYLAQFLLALAMCVG